MFAVAMKFGAKVRSFFDIITKKSQKSIKFYFFVAFADLSVGQDAVDDDFIDVIDCKSELFVEDGEWSGCAEA